MQGAMYGSAYLFYTVLDNFCFIFFVQHKLNYFLFCQIFEKSIYYLCRNFNNYYKIKFWSV
jgi:hypothetical protein